MPQLQDLDLTRWPHDQPTYRLGAEGAKVQANFEKLNAAENTQELTATGAVTAGVLAVELNSINSIVATIADASQHQGLFVIKATGHSDDHTLHITSGTINGTNNIALFEADNDALVLWIDSDGNGIIVANIGSVSLGTLS